MGSEKEVAFCYLIRMTFGDGKSLASGSRDETIKLWDVDTGNVQATLKGHMAEVYSVTYSPDGKTLASGSHDAKIKLWDMPAAKKADR